jgi:Fe-S cluster assembly iron-binding protein IscA
MDLDEKASAGDETIEKDGLKVFVDKEATESLSSKEIDYIKNEQGEGFVINGGEQSSGSSCSSGCSSCG